MATLDLDAEGIPTPTVESQPTTRVLLDRVDFGEGYAVSVPSDIDPVVTDWALVWTGLTKSARDTLIGHFAAQAGQPVLWTPPGESVQEQFTVATWDPGKPVAGRYRVTARFISDRTP